MEVYFLYPETANVRLEDMNALFGDATTTMPTPITRAERGSLMGEGSPTSIDLQRGATQPGVFSATDAIPGLDIDPPDVATGADGKPVVGESSRGRSESSREGLGGWIGRMVSRNRRERSGSARGGTYGQVSQDDS